MDSRTPLSRLDLNLLVALEALLVERNVSRAAQRLHRSQPSLSASLARLRAHFGDQLLARRGSTYELTPLAMLLAEHVASALEGARRVFEIESGWTPRDSSGEFSVYMSDYGPAPTAPIVARLALETAPEVRFRFLLHSPAVIDDAAQRLRSVDGIVLPHGFLNGLPFTDVWHDEWVIISSAHNPACEAGLLFEDLRSASWVLSYQTRTAFTSAIRQLQQLGVEPNVEVVAESFLAIPHFVIGTNRLAMVQRGVARIVRQLSGVAIHEPPYPATPLSNALWWHPMHWNDPSHEWMRGVFVDAGHELTRDLQRDASSKAS